MLVSRLSGVGVVIAAATGIVCCLLVSAVRSLRRAGRRVDAILTEELEHRGHRDVR